MAVKKASSSLAKELNPPNELEDDPKEVARQEKALEMIREWNKTLRMSIIKQSGPWELDDLPIHYRPPIPSLRQHHTPPVFIFGVPFTEDEIVDFTKHLQKYEEVLREEPLYQNSIAREFIRQHVEQAWDMPKFRRSVNWRVYYSKEEDTEAPFFLCVARSYDHQGFRDLREIAKKVIATFPNKRPMWYLDAIHNDLEREDWRIKGIPGICEFIAIATIRFLH
ncbi:hypothetical protein VNI00_010370 [Paramarasmius palmivorus]|uniref:Uncharacterized protein n=1 Tax=Paramarasmius palmivorus TaxID=297713 RepID=A0AAW0CKX0_9AGAR